MAAGFASAKNSEAPPGIKGEIVVNLFQAVGADASVFIADGGYRLIRAKFSWGGAGTASTLMVQKVDNTEAPGDGENMLAGTLSTTTTADTVQTPALHATEGNLRIADGQRLAIDHAGTPPTNFVATLTLVPTETEVFSTVNS